MKGLLKGLVTTLSTALRHPVTVQYPDERHPLPVRQRSFPVLLWDFDHEEPFCTGCNVCIRNCPVDCMSATMIDNPKHPEGTSNRRKIVDKFWIDYARCMRCNICVEVCPFEAIVMDNNWTGHEQSAYDRRDLHKDIEDLLHPSRSGALVDPFRPLDEIEALEKRLAGEAAPEQAFQGARPEARRRQEERIAQGLPAAIQERPPEAPKTTARAATGAGAAAGEEVEILSESKIRARRMRAEREAKEFTDRGEAVPAEVQARVDLYRTMKAGQAVTASGVIAGAAGGVGGAGTGEVLTGTHPDGSMRFPPGLGDGAKGDANSAEKVRARRMRAERQFRELLEKSEPIPDDLAKSLYDLGSDLAPGGTIWQALAGAAPAAVPGAGGPAAAAAVDDGRIVFPPGVGDGPKGDANSYEKVRARRMRAERAAREALARGEAVPADVIETLQGTGSPMAAEAAGGSV